MASGSEVGLLVRHQHEFIDTQTSWTIQQWPASRTLDTGHGDSWTAGDTLFKLTTSLQLRIRRVSPSRNRNNMAKVGLVTDTAGSARTVCLEVCRPTETRLRSHTPPASATTTTATVTATAPSTSTWASVGAEQVVSDGRGRADCTDLSMMMIMMMMMACGVQWGGVLPQIVRSTQMQHVFIAAEFAGSLPHYSPTLLSSLLRTPLSALLHCHRPDSRQIHLLNASRLLCAAHFTCAWNIINHIWRESTIPYTAGVSATLSTSCTA